MVLRRPDYPLGIQKTIDKYIRTRKMFERVSMTSSYEGRRRSHPKSTEEIRRRFSRSSHTLDSPKILIVDRGRRCEEHAHGDGCVNAPFKVRASAVLSGTVLIIPSLNTVAVRNRLRLEWPEQF